MKNKKKEIHYIARIVKKRGKKLKESQETMDIFLYAFLQIETRRWNKDLYIIVALLIKYTGYNKLYNSNGILFFYFYTILTYHPNYMQSGVS